MSFLKKAAAVIGCGACVAGVAGAVAGLVRRRNEVFEACEPCCGCCCEERAECDCGSPVSDEYKGFGCCGGGTGISSELGDLIPAVPGKLLMMRSDRFTFVAMATGVTPEQFKAYALECQEWGFDTPVPCFVYEATTGRPVPDSKTYMDNHNRTLSLTYGKKKGNLLVMLDASASGAR